MEIGLKIRNLRHKNDLTVEELANRCELTKGYISQLERDLTSPSIETLSTILEVLGSDMSSFFATFKEEKIVYETESYYENDNEDFTLKWLITNAQKNKMEPIIIEINPNKKSELVYPYNGEIFGYVLDGEVEIFYGDKNYLAKKGYSFYVKANEIHYLNNNSNKKVKVLWVSNPPIF
ncbi:XRE family transcriptional regulator [Spiroplasma endosymbiont of Anurida maritima]|uniref:helix-turn-helix domain-containing protein n=1 Tax=Spiroplasma endosymbiont of Anurida maritima TaxID=2967972 RepID=UPI0036D2B684